MNDADGSGVQTVGAWFAALEPAPPAALAARMTELLGPHLTRPRADVPDVCLAVGEQLLDALLACGSTSRGTALDLLAVDALVTYAFQAGADDPSTLEARAARAMERIAALPSIAQS